MPVFYEVNGYDSRSGGLTASFEVPDWRVPSVLRTAGVPQSDDGLGSYPLDGSQVSEIAALIGTTIEQEGLDFFLEPYEAPQEAAR